MIPVPPTLTEGTDAHRLFLALRSGQPKSHHELYRLHMIVHSRASDLRLKHGCLIDTWRDGRTTWYQLRSAGTVREDGVAEPDGGFAGVRPLGPSLTSGGSPDQAASSVGATSERRGTVSRTPHPEACPAQLTVWEAA